MSHDLISLLAGCQPAREIIGARLSAPFGTCALRASSRELRALFEAPRYTDPPRLLAQAARAGDLAMCELAFARLRDRALGAEKVLRCAAHYGHRAICEFAIAHGAHDWARMLRSAASGGRAEMCEYARSLGAWNMDVMLIGAARGGHVELCIAARDAGATDVREMARIAACRGHLAVCELAFSWGSRHYDSLFNTACMYGHLHICKFIHDLVDFHSEDYLASMLQTATQFKNVAAAEQAIEWGAAYSELALQIAVRDDCFDICKIILKAPGARPEFILKFAASHGMRKMCELVDDPAILRAHAEEMLNEAARCGHAEMCEYARDLGARNYNAMLLAAARGGHCAICKLAHSWGARDVDSMLIMAVESGVMEMCELALQLGAQNIAEAHKKAMRYCVFHIARMLTKHMHDARA